RDDVVALDYVLGALNRLQRPAYLVDLHGVEQQAAALVGANRIRLPTPEKLHAFVLGVLVFKVEGGHLTLTAPIEQVHGLSAEAPGRAGCIDGSIPCSDNYNCSGHLAQ